MEIASHVESCTLPLVLTNDDGGLINIEIRPDGYVNATKLCQAAGREWRIYYKSPTAKEFLKTLSEYEDCLIEKVAIPGGRDWIATNSTGNLGGIVPAPERYLVESGKNRFQHTWVHPDVAIHLAQWAWSDGTKPDK